MWIDGIRGPEAVKKSDERSYVSEMVGREGLLRYRSVSFAIEPLGSNTSTLLRSTTNK